MEHQKSNSTTVRIQKIDIKTADVLNAYLMDNQGNLIEFVSLKGGEAQLKTNASDIHGKTKLFIAAPIPPELGEKPVTEMLLKKMKAWQPSFHISSGGIIELPFIPPIPFPFPFKWCNITGSLTKTFTVDGESTVLPICNARVHICEIDPIWILWERIPDHIIIDLRDRLVEVVIKKPIPIPDPVPDLIIKPQPGPDSASFRKINRPLSTLTTPLSMLNLSNSEKSGGLQSSLSLPNDIQSGLLSPSLPVVRETILKNFNLFHPWLCFWPWYWPWFYKCDEIAVVNTDCNGRFDYNMLYFLLGDHPDIYIWVEVFINGQWETVYRPFIACHTYWNFACGTDINIRVTDPRVRPCVCDPLPGSVVWMKRVNNWVSMRRIQQHGSASGHLSNAIGLTSFATVDNVSPFGGSFPFIVQFGSGFPGGSVTHYRWRFRKLKDAFLTYVSDVDHMMEGVIDKPYTYEVASPGGTVFATGAFNLGPTYDAGNPKYRIPHVEASVDVPSEPTAEWNQDTYSINVNSPNFTDGLYDFTFELLDNVGNVIPVPANTFVVDRINSDPAGPSSIIADGLPEQYVIKNSAGQAIAFSFKMRIDNRICYADVLDALVDGYTTDTLCGFGHYNDKVNDMAILKFLAGHPHNFATYGFAVTKGNSNPVPIANSSGYVTQVNNLYTISTLLDSGVPKDLYQKEINVSSLLGTCTLAAFAEVLRVYATHTDGNVRIQGYDFDDTAAIAIAP